MLKYLRLSNKHLFYKLYENSFQKTILKNYFSILFSKIVFKQDLIFCRTKACLRT